MASRRSSRRGTIKFNEINGTYDKLDEFGNVLKNEKNIYLPSLIRKDHVGATRRSSLRLSNTKNNAYHAVKMTVTLPQTVYTSSILGPLLSNRNTCESVNHNIVMFISHLFQFTLIFSLASINATRVIEHPEKTCPVEEHLSILVTVCLILFITTMSTDFVETWGMLTYLNTMRKMKNNMAKDSFQPILKKSDLSPIC